MLNLGEKTKTRLTLYAAALGGAGLAAFNLADFDTTTGVLDIKPINIYALLGVSAAGAGNLLAVIAMLRGWGRK
jgi:hypothetical protein